MNSTPIRNALTVDVEDYFQVSAFAPHIARDTWDQLPCRVERNVDVTLALLDDHKRVRELDDSGRYRDAVLLSIGAEADDVEALNAGLRDQITAAQERMDAHAGDARGGFESLVIALPFAAALSALLVLAGLQRRIGEYG